MLLVDEDLILLEDYLDNALAGARADELAARVSRERDLAAALDELRADRAVRNSVWASFEPSDAETSQLIARIRSQTSRRRFTFTRPLRIAAAIAACASLSFIAGWKLRGGSQLAITAPSIAALHSPSPKVETLVSYQVALTDESGRVTAVQNFDSLEKANEFAGDLGRWQQRQHQVREGAAVIVADRF